MLREKQVTIKGSQYLLCLSSANRTVVLLFDDNDSSIYEEHATKMKMKQMNVNYHLNNFIDFDRNISFVTSEHL